VKYWDGRKWLIYATVVLPDHLHCLVQPLPHPAGGFFDLGEILYSIKSFSSHQINRRRGAAGSIWQIERYDRIVRDETEFLEKWNYIRNNPVKSGMVEYPEDYPWLYEKG
jgi:putative transposase